MDRRILDYQIANAKHSMEYLKSLSDTATSKFESNKLFNHALAISTIIDTAELINNTIAVMNDEIIALRKKVADLENKQLEPYLKEYLSRLKNDLIDVITLYPDLEY